MRPASLAVANGMSETLLRATAEALGIPLRRKARLPELDRELASLLQGIGI